MQCCLLGGILLLGCGDGCVFGAGTVSTLAGSVGSSGNVDGVGTNARFGEIYGLVVNSAGTIFVSIWNNHVIRQVTSSGILLELISIVFSPH